jgi:hypothetical protein
MRAMFCRILTVLAFVGALSASSRAQAAIVMGFTCTQVLDVTWDRGGLFIRCSNTTTKLKSGVGLCATQGTTIDDVKIFQTMANAALLAGKGLSSNCDDACGAGICFLGSLTILR